MTFSGQYFRANGKAYDSSTCQITKSLEASGQTVTELTGIDSGVGDIVSANGFGDRGLV